MPGSQIIAIAAVAAALADRAVTRHRGTTHAVAAIRAQ